MLYAFFSHILHIPLTLTQRKIDVYFCRFLTVSPIGGKFPPTAAPRTQYTVKGKNTGNFVQLFGYGSLVAPQFIHATRTYFGLLFEYVLNIFKNMYIFFSIET